MQRFTCWPKPEKECTENGYDQGENRKNKDAEILFIHKRSPEKGLFEMKIKRQRTKVKGKLT